MLVSLTVGKVDAGVTVLLTPDKRLIEFPSILLPPNISSGSIVDITVSRNTASESAADAAFQSLQSRIYAAFGASTPSVPVLRCRNATQTSVVLEWDPIALATADLVSLSLYRNGQKAGAIPRPLQLHSTKISGLAVDTEYVFHLVLRTSAGTYASEKVPVRTHKMTDLSGVTITTGVMPASMRERLEAAVERIGAKIVDSVRIDTTHFVTTEGRGIAWEKAVENNIPVVRPEWVEACEKKGRILGVTQFYLDALHPGPMADEGPATSAPAHAPAPAPAPVVTQKELPRSPAENDREPETPKPETPSSKARRNAVTPDDSGDEKDEKVISAGRDEQKVMIERAEQKVAVRSGPPAPTVVSEEEDEVGEEKPGVSPDGASFHNVAL